MLTFILLLACLTGKVACQGDYCDCATDQDCTLSACYTTDIDSDSCQPCNCPEQPVSVDGLDHFLDLREDYCPDVPCLSSCASECASFRNPTRRATCKSGRCMLVTD